MCSCPAAGRRQLAAFWLLGLLNNASYVIMIAGAGEVLQSSDALLLSPRTFSQ